MVAVDFRPVFRSTAGEPTLTELGSVLDMTYGQCVGVFDQLAAANALNVDADADGLTCRQALSHVVGIWQRLPLFIGCYLDPDFTGTVPVALDDSFWTAEWETTPLAGFGTSLRAAYLGLKALMSTLDPIILNVTRTTPFGDLSLGALLKRVVTDHLRDTHILRLAAFARG